MQGTIISTPHLSWVFSHIGGSCTAWQAQSTFLLIVLAVLHLQVMLSLCTLLFLTIGLSLEIDQETQNSCHIQYCYLGVLECIYKSFKGCKADPAEAHVHECTAQVGCRGVQVEKGCEAREYQGLANLESMRHCWMCTYLQTDSVSAAG